MSDRTGLNALELSVLDALDALGAGPTSAYKKSAHVVTEMYARRDIPPSYGYETLCMLAAAWLVHIPLVDGHGNFGSAEFPAAGARYTEARMARAGALALASERAELPRLPIGLINGDVHWGGTAPAFDPQRVAEAVVRAGETPSLPADEVNAIVGRPAFPTGCEVRGDVDALARGETIELRLSARVAIETDGAAPCLVISHPPPRVSIPEIGQALADRVNSANELGMRHARLAGHLGLAIREIRDESTFDVMRLVCTLEVDADVDRCQRQALQTWPVTTTLTAQLAKPLAALVKATVDRAGEQRVALQQLLASRT
jgi:DNA gyrase subunit A